jgi:hypothetical protein
MPSSWPLPSHSRSTAATTLPLTAARETARQRAQNDHSGSRCPPFRPVRPSARSAQCAPQCWPLPQGQLRTVTSGRRRAARHDQQEHDSDDRPRTRRLTGPGGSAHPRPRPRRSNPAKTATTAMPLPAGEPERQRGGLGPEVARPYARRLVAGGERALRPVMCCLQRHVTGRVESWKSCVRATRSRSGRTGCLVGWAVAGWARCCWVVLPAAGR